MKTPQKALIIGAGIGGLAAAIGLKNIGYEVAVFERAPELREVGAGLSLWANAIEALAYLGLAERVREVALPDLGGGIYTDKGDLIMSMTNRDLAEQFGDYSVMVHRAELHGLLLEALGPHVTLGKTFVGLEQNEAGVRARFADGSEAAGDLLIGADGLRSAVRAHLHGDAKPRYAGYTAWRAVVPFEHARLLPGETWGRGARFGRVPMAGGRVYWFATQNVAEGTRGSAGEKAELLEMFGGWHAPIGALLEATAASHILRNDIYDRPPLQSWGEGRVTLLGDAAHPMTPNLGQGACQALEDAVVLARCLTDAPIPAALATYERARKGRTRAIVSQSRRVGRVGQWRHALAVGLRNALFRRLPPGVQARQLERVLRFEP